MSNKLIKNLEPVSVKISTDRPLVKWITKDSKLSSNANLDLNWNFNILPLVQAHRLKNPKNVIISYLNVFFLINKFAAVEELIKRKIDVCLISETKISKPFPNQPFKVNGYRMIGREELVLEKVSSFASMNKFLLKL